MWAGSEKGSRLPFEVGRVPQQHLLPITRPPEPQTDLMLELEPLHLPRIKEASFKAK